MDSKNLPYILNELVSNQIIGETATVIKQHKGGTDSTLFEIENNGQKLALKIESKNKLVNVVSFCNHYKNVNLFPSIKYVDEDFHFFVYSFTNGDTCKRSLSEDEITYVINEVINKYTSSPFSKWGELESVKNTLYDFILADAEYNKELIDDALRSPHEFERIKGVIAKLFSKFSNSPYLTHGDLRTHNIVLYNNKIVRVIDPLVVNSLPVLELMFLIASKPPTIKIDDVIRLCQMLKDISGFEENELISLFKITIYIRIGRAVLYHPQDLQEYIVLYKSL